MSTQTTTKRPAVLTMAVRGKAAAFLSYIPIIKGGGLFLPTNLKLSLGDPVLLILSVLDDPSRIPISGTVVWVNPEQTHGGRPQGLGVALPDNEVGAELRRRFEGLLGGALQSSRVSHTV